MRLQRDFFERKTIWVAKNLLGKYLVRRLKGKRQLVGKIVETEAYIGPNDKASHAAFGKTKRCAPMYDKPGTAYVYFIYGMYWMLNIVTEEKGKPCAVLIRSLEPQEKILRNLDIKKLRDLGGGPGKLCHWMEIDGRFNGEDLVRSQRLWIEDRGVKIKPSEITSAKRIGVDYAGPWKDKPWRFYLKGNPFVSRR
ncbi:MAG: DNA-3-methyladenine glycosylase [Candidatus Omnitrophota bacterium]